MEALVWWRDEVLWKEAGGGRFHVHQRHSRNAVAVADLYHVVVWIVEEELQTTRVSVHARQVRLCLVECKHHWVIYDSVLGMREAHRIHQTRYNSGKAALWQDGLFNVEQLCAGALGLA